MAPLQFPLISLFSLLPPKPPTDGPTLGQALQTALTDKEVMARAFILEAIENSRLDRAAGITPDVGPIPNTPS